ncbi:MAG: hypothetical protein H0X38_03890 [Planctomycetes bacterium]|nr:hypothetical protein [Planctomycetota bacterium]
MSACAALLPLFSALACVKIVSALAMAPLESAKAKPRTPASALTPELKDQDRHAAFLQRIAAGPVGLLFIGDSITDFFPDRGADTWARFTAYHPADFGISADRTEHVLWRLSNGELDDIEPTATVILIGTNNIGHFDDEQSEWAAAGVAKVVATVRAKLPRTRILLLGVFPRDAKDSRHRQQVTEINAIIAQLADGKAVTWLDIGDRFLTADGAIDQELMPDGLHPSAKGYAVWYDAMWPTLEKLLAP